MSDDSLNPWIIAGIAVAAVSFVGFVACYCCIKRGRRNNPPQKTQTENSSAIVTYSVHNQGSGQTIGTETKAPHVTIDVLDTTKSDISNAKTPVGYHVRQLQSTRPESPGIYSFPLIADF